MTQTKTSMKDATRSLAGYLAGYEASDYLGMMETLENFYIAYIGQDDGIMNNPEIRQWSYLEFENIRGVLKELKEYMELLKFNGMNSIENTADFDLLMK